jgi:hypothetical protein
VFFFDVFLLSIHEVEDGSQDNNQVRAAFPYLSEHIAGDNDQEDLKDIGERDVERLIMFSHFIEIQVVQSSSSGAIPWVIIVQIIVLRERL